MRALERLSFAEILGTLSALAWARVVGWQRVCGTPGQQPDQCVELHQQPQCSWQWHPFYGTAVTFTTVACEICCWMGPEGLHLVIFTQVSVWIIFSVKVIVLNGVESNGCCFWKVFPQYPSSILMLVPRNLFINSTYLWTTKAGALPLRKLVGSGFCRRTSEHLYCSTSQWIGSGR